MAPVKPMLDDIELKLVQKIDTAGEQVQAQHSVPALEGDFLQGLGRRAVRVTLSGVMTGTEAAADLKTLREKFRGAEPVSFVADIATATKVEKVLIEEMGVRELAGKPERFEYALSLREMIQAPATATIDPVPDKPPGPTDPTVGTLIVEVVVEGEPDFDFGKVTVNAKGTGNDGTALSKTLTERVGSDWTETKMAPGQFQLSAVVTEEPSMSGTEQATVRPGQTTKVVITLRPGVLIAKAYVIHFRFDSAFIEPCLRQVLQRALDHAQMNPGEKVLIVGHTDLVGSDDYNQSLSERRARSVHAFLTFGTSPTHRAAAIKEWDNLRRKPAGAESKINDNWGVREYQYMLQDLGYYKGKIDEIHGPKIDSAIRAFQFDNELPETGLMNEATWPVLVEKYLDQDELAMPDSRFLPNADGQSCDGGLLKWLGCGEQDPVRNTEDAWRPNRRTEILFVAAKTLPCKVPPPVTFELPVPKEGSEGPKWCLGPGDAAKRACFLAREKAQPGKWLVQPAEPGKLLVNGRLVFVDGRPVTNEKLVLIAPDGEFLRRDEQGKAAPAEQPKGAQRGRPIAGRTDADGSFSHPVETPVGVYIVELPGLKDPSVARAAEDPPQSAAGNIFCVRLDQTTVIAPTESTPPAVESAVAAAKPAAAPAAPAPPKNTGGVVHPAPPPPVPINPIITPASRVVLVKKDYTTPKRVKITLKTSAKFTRKGTLSRTVTATSGDIRFFEAEVATKGEKEIDLSDPKGHTLTADELSAGKAIFAESRKPSGALDDFQLTLSLSKGPSPVGPDASEKLTAVELTLDIARKRTAPGVDPPVLSTDDKIKKGRFLRVQDTGKNNLRAMLIVRKPKPDTFSGNLVLERLDPPKTQVQVFKTAHEIPGPGQTPLGEPFIIKKADLAAGDLKLWVEGLTKSNTERETGYRLGLQLNAADVELEGDKVLMTVLPNIKVKGKLFWNRTWDYNTAPKLPATASIPAVKEFLPGAKVELHIQKPGAAALTLFKTVFLNDGAKVSDPHGAFEIPDVPETAKAALRVLLEYNGGKVVNVTGLSNAVSEADFEVKKDKTVFNQFDLDLSKWTEQTVDFDFTDVEIKKTHFVEICDAYKSIWFGHHRLKELSDFDAALCRVKYPEPTTGTSHQNGDEISILRNDLKDRDVLLHEYGHFVADKVGMVPAHPGYLYNDSPSHSGTSLEHYEAAWLEGPATFFSCALQDDPIYHDGYDFNGTMHLDTDNTTKGPHCEGSIQDALWRILKVHNINFKTGYWKAFTDKTKRTKINNVFEFFDNWKDLGLADLANVLEAFKTFNMEFGYKYQDGVGMFTAVAAPKSFNQVAKEFLTIDELFDKFGKLGAGTLAAYKEEFYNRNKFFNAGKLGAGSSNTDPKITVGQQYIIPVRFQVKT